MVCFDVRELLIGSVTGIAAMFIDDVCILIEISPMELLRVNISPTAFPITTVMQNGNSSLLRSYISLLMVTLGLVEDQLPNRL